MRKFKGRSKWEDYVGSRLVTLGYGHLKHEPFKMDYYIQARGTMCHACGSTDVRTKRKYLPDFANDKKKLVVEAKGRFLSTDRTKMKAVRLRYPDWRIVIVFMRDQKLGKGSNTTYTEWCKANNLEFRVGKEFTL